MSIIVKKFNETSFSFDDISSLIRNSFEEREKQGLHFTCAHLSAIECQKKTKNSVIFVAFDTIEDKLVGMGAICITKDENGSIYGHNEYNAILPNFKHKGIGSLILSHIFRYAKQKQCEYIISDTALGAFSSIKFHEKNGFKKIGLRAFGLTNYYSVIFRKQLSKPSKWSHTFFCKYTYIKSYIIVRLALKANGTPTLFHRIYHFFIKHNPNR